MAVTAMGWQAMKSEIIRELGQTDILLPALVAEGLAANDRIKVRMSALQAAAQHAREPGHPATDLSVECHTAGIAPASLASLIGGAHLVAGSRFAAFLKSALRHSTEALRAGRFARLARDQIEADLVRHLERVDSAPRLQPALPD